MSMFEIHGGFTGLAASSRVRLARNIKGYPFRLTEQQHSEIADKIFAALKENPTIGPEFDKKQIIPRSTEASQLVEEHLISPELAQNGGWLIVSKDSGVSIMVGEEDHLRLQVIGTGLCPKECLETANRVASLIEAALPFAYDERLGYLTACPTNIGTGLRASIMLHLPMLTATEQMDRILSLIHISRDKKHFYISHNSPCKFRAGEKRRERVVYTNSPLLEPVYFLVGLNRLNKPLNVWEVKVPSCSNLKPRLIQTP